MLSLYLLGDKLCICCLLICGSFQSGNHTERLALTLKIHSSHMCGFAICTTYLWTAHLCSLNKYDNERELERGVGAGGPEGSTSVAYYENPGILMIVQTIEDGKGNHITSCDSLQLG
jgi:hypothetical protein